MKEVKVRYPKIDILRGLCLISMIIYHTVWDLVYIYGFDWMWYRSDWAFVWQQSICWTFILLSGFCLPMGTHPVRRGIIVFVAGGLITAVTLIVMPERPIIFGVLTFIGSCAILVGVLHKFIQRKISVIPAVVGMAISFLLFAFTYSVNYRTVGVFGEELIRLPSILYHNYLTTFLGFPESGFVSTDYFSIVPWIFLFMTGYFAHFIIMTRVLGQEGKNRLCKWMQEGGAKPLEWMGRHSLLIYMLHQPIVYGVLWVIFR